MSKQNIKDLNRQIGRRLKEHRKAAKMTQSALAKPLGITYQQLQKYETGQDRISAARLAVVAVVLGVPVGAFFGEGAEAD